MERSTAVRSPSCTREGLSWRRTSSDGRFQLVTATAATTATINPARGAEQLDLTQHRPGDDQGDSSSEDRAAPGRDHGGPIIELDRATGTFNPSSSARNQLVGGHTPHLGLGAERESVLEDGMGKVLDVVGNDVVPALGRRPGPGGPLQIEGGSR